MASEAGWQRETRRGSVWTLRALSSLHNLVPKHFFGAQNVGQDDEWNDREAQKMIRRSRVDDDRVKKVRRSIALSFSSAVDLLITLIFMCSVSSVSSPKTKIRGIFLRFRILPITTLLGRLPSATTSTLSRWLRCYRRAR
ncbi:hypothetical protein PUN28_010754 [Cardiocondyla obscurior]|uniref:Uncharacterized protein n=1 Tax=Cardiocondyla obscurior TaxID=286306 RepID=A0AAW2FHX6_9HYME